jgi:hypothetical protein
MLGAAQRTKAVAGIMAAAVVGGSSLGETWSGLPRPEGRGSSAV